MSSFKNHGEMDAREVVGIIGFSSFRWSDPVSLVDNKNLYLHNINYCYQFFRFILQIENERDLDEYFSTLLNNENPTHRQFVTELKKRRGE